MVKRLALGHTKDLTGAGDFGPVTLAQASHQDCDEGVKLEKE